LFKPGDQVVILRVALLVVINLSLGGHALAWNEKGHVVVAKLAWLELTPEQRATATKLLKAHPHYDEFLSAERPEGADAGEWAFMRAAYWADWARSHHAEEFNHPEWHYFTAAFVPPYSKLKPSDLAAVEPNSVTQVAVAIEKLRSGTDDEKPTYLCWLLHLVGDMHQPLHNCSLLSETFPEGDKGGNLSLIRVEGGKPTKLHFMFDSLLGKDTSVSSISKAVVEVQRAEHDNAESIARELREHTTPAQWQAEGFALAVKYAYLDGDLRPANSEAKLGDDDVPNVAEVYAQNAGRMVRVQVAKAGKRLATALAQGLGETADTAAK
jgi:hypothetical protein